MFVHASDVLGTRSSLARQRHKKKARYASHQQLTDSHAIGPSYLLLTKATKKWGRSLDTSQNIDLLGLAPPMSAMGQKQTFALHQPMSALPPIATAKADMCSAK